MDESIDDLHASILSLCEDTSSSKVLDNNTEDRLNMDIACFLDEIEAFTPSRGTIKQKIEGFCIDRKATVSKNATDSDISNPEKNLDVNKNQTELFNGNHLDKISNKPSILKKCEGLKCSNKKDTVDLGNTSSANKSVTINEKQDVFDDSVVAYFLNNKLTFTDIKSETVEQNIGKQEHEELKLPVSDQVKVDKDPIDALEDSVVEHFLNNSQFPEISTKTDVSNKYETKNEASVLNKDLEIDKRVYEAPKSKILSQNSKDDVFSNCDAHLKRKQRVKEMLNFMSGDERGETKDKTPEKDKILEDNILNFPEAEPTSSTQVASTEAAPEQELPSGTPKLIKHTTFNIQDVSTPINTGQSVEPSFYNEYLLKDIEPISFLSPGPPKKADPALSSSNQSFGGRFNSFVTPTLSTSICAADDMDGEDELTKEEEDLLLGEDDEDKVYCDDDNILLEEYNASQNILLNDMNLEAQLSNTDAVKKAVAVESGSQESGVSSGSEEYNILIDSASSGELNAVKGENEEIRPILKATRRLNPDTCTEINISGNDAIQVDEEKKEYIKGMLPVFDREQYRNTARSMLFDDPANNQLETSQQLNQKVDDTSFVKSSVAVLSKVEVVQQKMEDSVYDGLEIEKVIVTSYDNACVMTVLRNWESSGIPSHNLNLTYALNWRKHHRSKAHLSDRMKGVLESDIHENRKRKRSEGYTGNEDPSRKYHKDADMVRVGVNWNSLNRQTKVQLEKLKDKHFETLASLQYQHDAETTKLVNAHQEEFHELIDWQGDETKRHLSKKYLYSNEEWHHQYNIMLETHIRKEALLRNEHVAEKDKMDFKFQKKYKKQHKYYKEEEVSLTAAGGMFNKQTEDLFSLELGSYEPIHVNKAPISNKSEHDIIYMPKQEAAIMKKEDDLYDFYYKYA